MYWQGSGDLSYPHSLIHTLKYTLLFTSGGHFFVMNVKLYAGTLSIESVVLCRAEENAHLFVVQCQFCDCATVVFTDWAEQWLKKGILIWHPLEQKPHISCIHTQHHSLTENHLIRSHLRQPAGVSLPTVQSFKFALL